MENWNNGVLEKELLKPSSISSFHSGIINKALL